MNSYLFGVEPFYRLVFYSNISFLTAVALTIISSVLLIMNSDVGWMAHLLARGQGGKAARSLIPAVIGIPVALSLGANWLYDTGLVDTNFLLSLMSVGTTWLLGAMVIAVTRKVSTAEDDLLAAMQGVRSARDRAKIAEMSKTNFLANMSHELRTPMNAVLGFTDLLLRSNPTPEQRYQLDMISESGSSMMSLLDGILDLSRIEAGKVVVENAAFDVRRMLRHAVRFMRGAATQKGLDLRLRIGDEVPKHIRGDRFRMLQILANLIGNAIKFTPAGWISISADVVDQDGVRALQISVTDTGVGIALDKQEQLFDEFVQADSSISRRFGGSGLGLAISRKLAELLGGEISLESEPGKGTTFFVTLPLEEASPEEIIGKSEKGRGNPTKRQIAEARILVAEDHELNQRLISAQLKDLGYEFDLVYDGDMAIAKVREKSAAGEPYSLILMDIQMPDVDGVMATRQIRSNGVTAEILPIIAVTAHAFEDDINSCIAAGMQDHIAKPVKIEVLQEKLSRWLPDRSVTRRPASGQSQDYVQALRSRYVAFKAGVTRQLDDCHEVWPDVDREKLEALGSQLHRLAGNAALFEEPVIGDLALRLEEEIRKASPDRDDTAIKATIAELLSKLGDD